ncbi:uncharacterized protein LOC125849935 [Solanum stenotomum]|uniref:uncharacterized protein LOC125849935 n=1 Tax=Solanum stenotomum TaxID=172797 RepID=UPI0020D1E4E9|nr:uncharacterized protein LOC125849935 [Solanum stenotomum]
MNSLMIKVCFFLVLISNAYSTKLDSYPPTCQRIECPNYDVIESGKDYEIRRYNSPMWMSTEPIDDISFVSATRTGFLRLFMYIQGKNDKHEKIEMTAPVMTQVKPSDGPLCSTSFVVSFNVPKNNQQNPPSAEGLHPQKWNESSYAAVRQFSGFVVDADIPKEAAALSASIAGTKWAAAIEKSRSKDNSTLYTVAQYNSPFEFRGRVNEMWFTFVMDSAIAI